MKKLKFIAIGLIAMEPMTWDNTKHIAVWQNMDQIIMYDRY